MKNGFTVVEFMIVVAIVGILFAIAYPQYMKYKDPNWRREYTQKSSPIDKPSFECIGGYKFVMDKDGNPIQIIGSNGNGVECF